jgi:hypothetical protein
VRAFPVEGYCKKSIKSRHMEKVASVLRVLWAPRDTLLRASKKPVVLVPLILIALLAAAEAATVFIRVDAGRLRAEAIQREGLSDNVSIDDQIAMMDEVRELVPAVLVTQALRPVVIVAAAGIFFAAFSIVGRSANFVTFLSITVLCFVPLVVRSLASILTLAVAAPSLRTVALAGNLSPAMLFDPQFASSVLYLGMAQLDLVTLWILALLVVGFGYVCGPRVTVGHRIVVVFGLWLLATSIWLGFVSVAI